MAAEHPGGYDVVHRTANRQVLAIHLENEGDCRPLTRREERGERREDERGRPGLILRPQREGHARRVRKEASPAVHEALGGAAGSAGDPEAPRNQRCAHACKKQGATAAVEQRRQREQSSGAVEHAAAAAADAVAQPRGSPYTAVPTDRRNVGKRGKPTIATPMSQRAQRRKISVRAASPANPSGHDGHENAVPVGSVAWASSTHSDVGKQGDGAAAHAPAPRMRATAGVQAAAVQFLKLSGSEQASRSQFNGPLAV